MSFVERFILLRPYLGESTIRGSTVYTYVCTFVAQMNNKCLITKGIILLHSVLEIRSKWWLDKCPRIIRYQVSGIRYHYLDWGTFSHRLFLQAPSNYHFGSDNFSFARPLFRRSTHVPQ